MEGNQVNLVFYGDRTVAKMFKSSLMPFKEGIQNFKEGPRILLNKAVKEAVFEMYKESQKKKLKKN